MLKRLVAVLAIVGSTVATHAMLLASPVEAECLPCVYVRNDSPYFYAEVCPPVR